MAETSSTGSKPSSGKKSSVLETLSLVSGIAGGIGGIFQAGATIWNGIKGIEEAEKAQAYKDMWTERLYTDEMRQQALQNKMNAETNAQNMITQRLNRELASRNEDRKSTMDWHDTMQNAANKYADILNRTRALRQSNAAAFRNR